jgi:hypothetical protein
VLKGGTAMLARVGPDARHTRDIDLLNLSGSLRDAEQALQAAAQFDLGDFFSFTLAPGQLLTEGVRALRVPVDAYLGVKLFARFHVDLVVDLLMTGDTDTVSGLVPADIPGLKRTSYIAYPLVDHIADKVCALHETHERSSGVREPSSRYRDVADLAVFAHTAKVEARALEAALNSEVTRRGMILPESITVPANSDWSRGYARVARDAPRLQERDLGAAIATLRLFIDPVLDASAHGRWNRDRLIWTTTADSERESIRPSKA